MFSYLSGHSEDGQECRIYWFLHALSNMFLSFWSLRGLLGVQNILIFACFEQYVPIFEVTPRTARSAEYIDSYMPWARFPYLLGHSKDCQECRRYLFLHALSNVSLSFLVTLRIARSAEHIDLYMLWAMFPYLIGHSEDCQECRIYWFLHALSNIFLSSWSLRGQPGVHSLLGGRAYPRT